jgi:fructose-bisphosphate aldolase class II
LTVSKKSCTHSEYPSGDAWFLFCSARTAGRNRQFGGDMKETYGVPVEEIVTGIKHGVRKINIDTDIRLAMTGAIRRFMFENPGKFDPREYMKPARAAAKEVCKARYLSFGCEGQAYKIKPLSLEKVAEQYKKGLLSQIVN